MNTSNLISEDLKFNNAIKILHDEKLVIEAFKRLAMDLPAESKQIQTAFEQQDWAHLSYLVDKLCDIALYTGMKNIEQLTKRIYSAIYKNDFTHLNELLNPLYQEILLAAQAAKEELNFHHIEIE